MTDDEAGRLLKAIVGYQLGEDLEIDRMTKFVFAPFKSQFERDEENYQKTVERNRSNGSKGGRPNNPEEPTGLNNNPKKPTGLSGLNKKPKKADNDSDSKNDSDSEKDKPLVLPHLSERFKKGWEILIKEPKWKKKSKNALRLSLVTLGKVSEEDAIEMMKNCIEGGWQKLYPLKKPNDLFGSAPQENIYKPSERYPIAE